MFADRTDTYLFRINSENIQVGADCYHESISVTSWYKLNSYNFFFDQWTPHHVKCCRIRVQHLPARNTCQSSSPQHLSEQKILDFQKKSRLAAFSRKLIQRCLKNFYETGSVHIKKNPDPSLPVLTSSNIEKVKGIATAFFTL